MFDYYYGNEAEQFSFLRVPKFLFTHKTFASMSCDAKILYSLMLDRMGLSVKNNWLDEENRVYIIFTQDEARQCMNFGNDKCVKTFKELEEIGLISRKNRGMGRPALIYVKNFVHEAEEVSDEEIKTSENQKSRHRENRSHEVGKTEVLTSENQKSRVTKNRSNEIGKTDTIKTDNIKTDFSETEFNQSINPAQARDRPIERVNCSAEKKTFGEILGALGYVPERCSYRFASDPPQSEEDFAAFDEKSRRTDGCFIPYEFGNDEAAMGTALRFLFGYSYYAADTDKRHMDFADIVIGTLAEMACAEKTRIQDGYVLGKGVIAKLNGLIRTSSLSDCIWEFEGKWEGIIAETKMKNPRSYLKSTLYNWLSDYKLEDFCYAF